MTEHLGTSRRSFLAGAGLAVAGAAVPASLLTACGSGSGSKGSGTGKVSVWMDIQGDANQKYWDSNVAAGFHKANPKIDLKTTYYKGNDLRRLIQTALQSRSGPDVVRGPSATQTLTWSKANTLADLTAYSKQYDWSSKLKSWAMSAFTNDGKIFALPLRIDTMLLYYNKTLFADKGYKQPTNRDELEALATELKGQGITPFGSSNVDWAAASEWLMTVFWNHYAGPDAIYKALTGEVEFTDPIFVEAVQLLKSYFDKGWLADGTKKYFSVPSQELGAQFGKGKIAMIPQGEWFMSQVGTYFGSKAGNGNDWDWMPLPALSKDVTYPLFEVGIGGSLAINKASKSQDAAAKFLNYYFGDKEAALKRMADVPATYNIPIDFDPSQIPSTIDPRAKRVLTSVNDAVSQGKYGYVTWTWWPPKSDVFIYQGLDKVLTGKSTPSQYCADLAKQFKAEKSAGTIPQIIKR